MIKTKRLKIVPLSHEQLLLYKNDPPSLAEAMGVHYLERQNDPATANDLQEAIEFWIQNTLEHRDTFEWYTNWEIILLTEQVAIGGIGFAGAPNEEGTSEIGCSTSVLLAGWTMTRGSRRRGRLSGRRRTWLRNKLARKKG